MLMIWMIFSTIHTGSAAVIARKIGAGTGRVIYLLDALDDLQEDMKKGRYNPFLLSYGRALTEEEKKSVKDAILLYLSDMEAAFDLMDAAGDPTRREILNNILYLGMPQAVDRVLAGKKCQKEEHYEQ